MSRLIFIALVAVMCVGIGYSAFVSQDYETAMLLAFGLLIVGILYSKVEPVV